MLKSSLSYSTLIMHLRARPPLPKEGALSIGQRRHLLAKASEGLLSFAGQGSPRRRAYLSSRNPEYSVTTGGPKRSSCRNISFSRQKNEYQRWLHNSQSLVQNENGEPWFQKAGNVLKVLNHYTFSFLLRLLSTRHSVFLICLVLFVECCPPQGHLKIELLA